MHIKNRNPITKRQDEILLHLSKGKLYKEIAYSIGITEGTLKQHINKLYGKLGCNNKVEAINIWRDNQEVDLLIITPTPTSTSISH